MNELKHEEHHVSEVEQLKEFANTYGKTIAISLVIVLIAALGFRLYRSHRQAGLKEASALFTTARSVQDLEALVNEYGSAPSATLAKLRLAKSYFDSDKYDLAIKTYKDLVEQDPNHPLAAAAKLGIDYCLAAQGQTEEALRGFDEFLTQNPDHFLTAEAVFGKAQCLDGLARTADAKAVVEDYIATHPDSRWMAPAQEMLDRLDKKLASAATVRE